MKYCGLILHKKNVMTQTILFNKRPEGAPTSDSFKFIEEAGHMEDTMIVFTSDHGDYQGDHWLGEKELFHEQIVRVPMIIYSLLHLKKLEVNQLLL